MTDQPQDRHTKSPVEAALEALVYAPVGLFFEGSTLLPQLVEKGRNQVSMARMIGQFALKQAGEEAGRVTGKLQDQAAGILDFIGGSVAPTTFEPPPPPASPVPPAAEAPGERTPPARRAKPPASRAPKSASPARQAARRVAGAAAEPSGQGPAPADIGEPGSPVAALAIPDYDGLSASQVVNRLAGLTPEELDAVRRYELGNRGRKTILSKIAQLQS